jgi:hypothetical protein
MAVQSGKRDHLPGVLRGARIVMLVLLTLVVVAATAAAVAESYNGLYNWALEHSFLPGWEANIAPLMVDTFIVAGEAMLFVLIVDRRHVGWVWIPILSSLVGLSLSFIGNVDRLRHVDIQTRLGHGLAPVAAAFGLLMGMVLLHLIAGDYDPLVPAPPKRKQAGREWSTPWPTRPRPFHRLRVWWLSRRAVELPPIAPPPVLDERPAQEAVTPVATVPPPPAVPKPPAAPRTSNQPSEQELVRVWEYLRTLQPGAPGETDRKLATRFYGKPDKQRRAMGRVLTEFRAEQPSRVAGNGAHD